MKTRHFAAALIAASALAVPAMAQQRPAILIVDAERIARECTACRAASTQVQQRDAQITQRAQQLNSQLETEGKPIQDAFNALGGKQPDAALQQRIRAFETKQQNARQEIANSQRTLQSTIAHVNQQIGARLVQVVEQARARRGATVVLTKGSTVASDPSADITAEVLTALNAALPSVSVTPLPQQQQQTPQGR